MPESYPFLFSRLKPAGLALGLAWVLVAAIWAQAPRPDPDARLAGDPPDVMISPRLNNVGLFEFYRAEESIKAGEEAAERALGDIMETVARLSA